MILQIYESYDESYELVFRILFVKLYSNFVKYWSC